MRGFNFSIYEVLQMKRVKRKYVPIGHFNKTKLTFKLPKLAFKPIFAYNINNFGI